MKKETLYLMYFGGLVTANIIGVFIQSSPLIVLIGWAIGSSIVTLILHFCENKEQVKP